MKSTTIRIKEVLDDYTLTDQFIKYEPSDVGFKQYETSKEELTSQYLYLTNILREEIETGRLDDLPFRKRVDILNALLSISNNRRSVNHVAQHVDYLNDYIISSNVLVSKIGKSDFVKEHKELNKLKNKYSAIIESLNTSQIDFDFIKENRDAFNDALRLAEERNDDIQELLDNSTSFKNQLDEQFSSFQNKLTEIRETEEDIEEKRVSITRFSNNIEEYKSSIEKLETDLKTLLKKNEEVETLIEAAHAALNLGSTVGISSAFAKQYEDANKPLKRIGWIIGAAIFLLIASWLTVWIVSDVKNSDKLAVLVGRIVAVGITLAGAVFCSRQYLKQKHIAEDYAYKAVLSKSIVAFTEEIFDSDDNSGKHVGNYLNKVLTEIHKDPLRERGTTKTKRGFSDKQMEQITEVVKTIVEGVKPA